EHTSWRIPTSRPRSRVRAPPPIVSWPSMTTTSRPPRAIVTAAANPFGPDPTTTTSTCSILCRLVPQMLRLTGGEQHVDLSTAVAALADLRRPAVGLDQTSDDEEPDAGACS